MDPRLHTYLEPERRLWEDEQAANNTPWHIFNLEQSRLQTEVENAEGYTGKRAARTALKQFREAVINGGRPVINQVDVRYFA
jgi:hypothetical protein